MTESETETRTRVWRAPARAIDLTGRRVLVVGLGASGVAAARLCAARGARVTVNDRRAEADLGAALAELPAGVDRVLGGHPEQVFTLAQLIVVSPGVPELPPLAAARRAGVPVTGELELASRFVEAPMVAITGTNGKSTTTTLCGAIFEASGFATFTGGNLGRPLAEAVGTPAAEAIGRCVVEASSFQLETVETFRPHVAVLLNVTADHLDRYQGMAGYAAAKARIFAAQGPDDFAVVNADDPIAMDLSRSIAAHRLPVSATRRLDLPAGAWRDGDALVLRLPDGREERYPALLPALPGRHNQGNALAALLAARLGGASAEGARRGLLAFQALPHRMQLCGTADDVIYYDDSKGTNVGAVVAALADFPRPVVLIAGGRDKGGDYAPLVAALAPVARGAVVIGEAAERIAAALSALPSLPVVRAGSMEEAVAAAARLARPGDAVVLSPACSSFDMFRDYHHRGQVFRAAVSAVVVASTEGR
jgi:UDP-N-acetylmuramoylalanine--D-glutamate ligase